ncbi:MAG: dienelactone hydrolase family protein, partial [Deltaproteobacteria bacterium]
MKRIEIQTEDGTCPAHVFGTEGLPRVLFYMDGPGIRPALFEMAERIAAAGYRVLLPDLFYRSGPYAPMDPKVVFADPAKRAELFSRYMS